MTVETTELGMVMVGAGWQVAHCFGKPVEQPLSQRSHLHVKRQPVENPFLDVFNRSQVLHSSRLGKHDPSRIASPITPPRSGLETEWLKASRRDAFSRKSRLRFTVFSLAAQATAYAAACVSAGGMTARNAGGPPVLFTTPTTVNPISDIGATSWGLSSHTSTA